MKKHFLVLLTIFASSFLLFAQGKNILPSEKNCLTIEQNQFSLDTVKDSSIIMLNIWGTFCSPSIKEMPDLQLLQNQYGTEKLQIIGIPVDVTDFKGNIKSKKLNSALDIVKTTGVKYPNLVPTKSMLSGFLSDVQVVPTTIFIDKNGKQLGETYYGSRTKEQWQKIVDSLL